MREVDFLPESYHRSLRLRRSLIRQGWLMGALLLAAVLRAVLLRHHASAAAAEATRVQAQVLAANVQLAEADALMKAKALWAARERQIESLGAHVGAARVLAALDEAMPGGVALTDLQFDEDGRPSTTAPATAPAVRRLRVRVEGVAVTAGELQKFVGKLGGQPFFEGVTVGFSRDVIESGRAVRQFELSLSVDLNRPM